jgi:hypothetical protein
MKWIKKQRTQTTVVDPDAVRVKPKPTLAVMEPGVVAKKRRAKKKILVPKELMKAKSHGLHDDCIPAGTLCYLRKAAQRTHGFAFCTVLKTHVDAQARRVWADVLTPDGTVRVIDAMWLRNTTVENGNLEESDDPQVTILGEQHT